jgi:hypothetical protein
MKDNTKEEQANPFLAALKVLDLTQIFKTKSRRGDLMRWSAKRTVGGAVVLEALYIISTQGLSWQAVTLCGIGVLPLCLSFFENRKND